MGGEEWGWEVGGGVGASVFDGGLGRGGLKTLINVVFPSESWKLAGMCSSRGSSAGGMTHDRMAPALPEDVGPNSHVASPRCSLMIWALVGCGSKLLLARVVS